MQSSKPLTLLSLLVCTSMPVSPMLATIGSWKSKMKRQVAEYWVPRSEQRHSPSHLIQEQEDKDIPKEVTSHQDMALSAAESKIPCSWTLRMAHVECHQ